MKRQFIPHLLAALLGVVFTLQLHAQTTAFTYQGRLSNDSQPASGSYDLVFSLHDASLGGNQVGSLVTNSAVVVNNGVFSVLLDFGAGVFNGEERWLAIGVRSNPGGPFTALSGRQPLTSSPYAIRALESGSAVSALNATTANTASAVATGGVGTDALLPDAVITSKIADGTIAEDDLNPVLAAGTFWRLDGNEGTTAGANFIGTKDNQPLEFKANGTRLLRLERTGLNTANLIGGSPLNYVDPGLDGVTIAGGGLVDDTLSLSNVVRADFSSIGGGLGNVIDTDAQSAVISGGAVNTIGTNAIQAAIGGGGGIVIGSDAEYAAVGGGLVNIIQSGAASATIGGGDNNVIGTNSILATISGGSYGVIKEDNEGATIGGGSSHTIGIRARYSVVGGGFNNTIQTNAAGTVIGGGSSNLIQTNAAHATIGGGFLNKALAGARYAAIAGGYQNEIGSDSESATIAGGERNTIGGDSLNATIAGGYANRIGTNSGSSVISGGSVNIINSNAVFAVVPGGYFNKVEPDASYSFAAGQRAKAAHPGVFVWADSTEGDFASTRTNQFNVRANGGVRLETGGAGLTIDGQPLLINTGGVSQFGTTDNQPLEFMVSGRRALRLEDNVDGSDAGTTPDGAPNVIGGSPGNFVAAGVVGVTIAGGGSTNWDNFGPYTNSVLSDYGFIGGGMGNRIDVATLAATIAGGRLNEIGILAAQGAIGGGYGNEIGDGSGNATIAGGFRNNIGTNSESGVIGGGYQNIIADNSVEAAIGGGTQNEIGLNADHSTIGGGYNNTIGPNAIHAVIPGGRSNGVGASAAYGLAAGRRAQTLHEGAFTWADSTDAAFASTRVNQFNIRANGGVRIDSGTGPGISLNAVDRPLITRGHDAFTTGNYVGAGRWGLFMEPHTLIAGIPAIAGKSFRVSTYNADSTINKNLMTVDQAGTVTATTFNPTSDRNAKENFTGINPTEVLEKVAALPISRWNFKQNPEAGHVGPMAQDFHAAFGVGSDDKHIATVDADGIALAAIQGLNEKVESRSKELLSRSQKLEVRSRELAEENAVLKRELSELRDLVQSLVERSSGGLQ